MKTAKWPQLTLIAVIATAWLYAFAANRKVTIPVDATGIKLFNGWTAAVTFNATCFDSTGAQTFSSTSVSLGAKQSTNFVSGGGVNCGDGTALDTTGSFLNGMAGCSWATDYTGAMNNCPGNYEPCSPTQYQANRNSFSTDGFLTTTGLSSTWSYSTDSGTTWVDMAVGGSYKPRASYASYEKCATGAQGAGTQIDYCVGEAGFSGVLCCPTGAAGVSTSCTVEVIGNSGGYLQSPQFKGNSPF